MSGEERGKVKGGQCNAAGGGYTIFLEEERIRSFLDAGDYSSAGELDNFKEVGAQIEKRVREGSGVSFLALSIGEKSISRDFTVLEVAHILAKHGKSVLIVDCDFIHPGLSGIVENVEEHGFLDLLLYGSSLKTVARSVGIDGVSVTGPGSFPVSRTIPFALKEFSKIKEFLRTKHDVVIYCSTLYTEDAKINPLASLVEGVVLCCRIEEMPEGELQKNLEAIGAEKVPPVELVCFCGRKEHSPTAEFAAKAGGKKSAAPEIEPVKNAPSDEEKPLALPVLDKGGEIESLEKERKSSVNIPRMVTIGGAIIIAAFMVWWVVISRTVREKEPQGTPVSVAERRAGAGGDERAPDASTVPAESLGAGTTARDDSARAGRAVGSPERGAPAPDSLRTRAPSGSGRYAIHISSFKEMFRAEAEKAYLEKNNFPARIVEVDIKGEKWLRIFVGAYATMDEASKARLELLGLSRVGYARIVEIEGVGR